MVYVRRISPQDGLIREIVDQRNRLKAIETRPLGNVTSREEFRSVNGDGIETVIGEDGLEQYINDITPPNRPSAPSKLEPTIGGILLTWDGKDWLGGVQPKDYSHTDVEVSDNDGATWVVASVVTATSPNTTVTGLVSGKTYSIRLRSFDANKNASEYSSIVSGGKVVDLVDPTEMINELREEYDTTMNELESSLADNTERQIQLDASMRHLREVQLPGVELTIADAQKSIVSTEKALALIPGDIAAAKQQAIDSANESALAAISAAQISGNSLVQNGNFEKGQTGWSTTAGVTIVAAAARAGTLGMRVAPTTANVWPINTSEIQTSTGRTYYMEMWVKRTGTDTTSTGSLGFVVHQRNTAGTLTSTVVQGYATEGVSLKIGDISTTTFTKVFAEFTIAIDNINRVQFAPWFKGPSSNIYFVDDVLVVDITESKTALSKAITAASLDAAAKVAEAERALTLVAQGFANKAKDDAVSSSLNTIIEKANTAKAEAIEASQLSAELLATAAKNAAVEVANAAQRTASQAIDDALAANNLAGSKGKVLVQSTAPGAVDRNNNTLWIDTSGTPAGNIPKKWVSGITWTAVTDKTAVDAAAAAAKAISDAEAAGRKAATAEETAGNAMQAAGSKTKVHYSTANPSGIGAVGDTWRKIDSNGDVIGEWRYTGGSVPWTAQLVTSTMLSNVDIGKLTVGTAVMQTGVADEFFAKIFATNKLYAENIIIGEAGNSHPDPFFKDTEGWKPFSILPTGGRNGNPALVIPASASQSGHYYGANDRNRQFPIVGGSTYRATVYVKADAATPANGVSLYAKWTNPTTAIAGQWATPNYVHAPALVANVWTPLTGIFEFPEQASRAFLGFFTQTTTNVRVLFSEPTVVRLIDTALVVEGGIKARNIEASEEMSAKIGRFLEVSTDMLVAGEASITTGVADKFFAEIFATRKLSATQVFIGQAGNLIPNGYGEMRSTDNFPGTSIYLDDPAAKAVGAEASFWVNGTRNFTNTEWFSLREKAVYTFSVYVRSSVAGKRFYAQLITPEGVSNIYLVSNQTTTTSFVKYVSDPFEAPKGATKGRVMIYGNHSNGSSTDGYQWFTGFDFREMTTPSLVVDGLVSGQNIIGAIIQTNPAVNRGIVINKDGMVAYSNAGAETLRFDGINSMITGATIRTAASGARVQLSTTGLEAWNSSNEKYLSATGSGLDLTGTVTATGDTRDTATQTTPILYSSRAILGRRSAGAGLDQSPGLWLEIDVNGTKQNNLYPAGVRSTSPYTAQGAVLQSAQVNVNGSNSYVSVEPQWATIEASQPYTNGYASSAYMNLTREGGYNIQGRDGYGGSGNTYSIIGTSRRNGSGVGELDLYARQVLSLAAGPTASTGTIAMTAASINMVGSVSINGTVMDDSGWKLAVYASPWTSYGNGFSPLSYRVMGGILYVMGSIKGGASGSRIATLPAGFRPTIPTGTQAIEAPLTSTQGGNWYAGSLWIYGDGRLVYTSPPGIWSGQDRVIINASFPLK